MVAVGSALRVLGGGLYFYGFSVFFLPISQDLGLSRAATSLVFSLARAQGAFEGPVAGYFMDRYGPRPLILMAIVMSGVGHMLLSDVQSYFALLLIYLGVVSLSFQAGFMDAPMVIANTWFIRMRTMAMSLISASVNLGGFLLTPLLAWAIHTLGLEVRCVWQRHDFSAGGITAGPTGASFAGEHGPSTRRRSPLSSNANRAAGPTTKRAPGNSFHPG